jgi:hypothetical protein
VDVRWETLGWCRVRRAAADPCATEPEGDTAMSQSSAARSWAWGGTMFAATMLLLVGMFQVFQGIEAIVRSGFYVVANNYLYQIDTTAWGWIHLCIGAVAMLTGAFLFLSGSAWARGAGIALAGLSAIANFFFIPYYPFWSLLIIALDVFVIWSLATVGSRSREAQQQPGGMDAAAERWPMSNQTGTSASARMDAPTTRTTPSDGERPAEAPGSRQSSSPSS